MLGLHANQTQTATAHIAAPFEILRLWARKSEYYTGHDQRDDADGLELLFGSGKVGFYRNGADSLLKIDCYEAAGGQGLRDFCQQLLLEAGFIPIWIHIPKGRHADARPDNLYFGTVVAIQNISPSFRRVTIAGPELEAFLSGGLHFRILLGPAGAAWPSRDAQGLTVWPGGIHLWHRPVYTIRAAWQQAGRIFMSFDIFLHDGGRITEWSKSLKINQEIALIGPSGGDIPQGSEWIGLFGDETALPAIARILAALPDTTKGQVHIIITHPDDQQNLLTPPELPCIGNCVNMVQRYSMRLCRHKFLNRAGLYFTHLANLMPKMHVIILTLMA